MKLKTFLCSCILCILAESAAFAILTPSVTYAVNLDYQDFNYDTVYDNHLSEISFTSKESPIKVHAKIIDICERNNEILEWCYQYDSAGNTWIYNIVYEWRPTSNLLYDIDTSKLTSLDYKFRDEVDKIIGEIIQDDTSDYSKIYKIYNWIQDNTEYEYEAIKKPNRTRSEYGGSAESALFMHKAICAGQSDLFYYMTNLAGIECKFVHGGDHSWNTVKLNDKWYFIDVTRRDIYCFLRGTDWAEVHGYVLDESYLNIDVEKADYAF